MVALRGPDVSSRSASTRPSQVLLSVDAKIRSRAACSPVSVALASASRAPAMGSGTSSAKGPALPLVRSAERAGSPTAPGHRRRAPPREGGKTAVRLGQEARPQPREQAEAQDGKRWQEQDRPPGMR